MEKKIFEVFFSEGFPKFRRVKIARKFSTILVLRIDYIECPIAQSITLLILYFVSSKRVGRESFD